MYKYKKWPYQIYKKKGLKKKLNVIVIHGNIRNIGVYTFSLIVIQKKPDIFN